MKILKGDKVKILIGKDKGREGLVIKAFKKSSLVVKDLNIFKNTSNPLKASLAVLSKRTTYLHLQSRSYLS